MYNYFRILLIAIAGVCVLVAIGTQDTSDQLQNTITVNVYSYHTEYIENGKLLYTLYDPAHYDGLYCALTVVNSSGHTCVTNDDKSSYVPNILEDLDSYWQG